MRVALINSPVMPTTGVYRMTSLTEEEVRKIFKNETIVSFLNPRHKFLVEFVAREFQIPPDSHSGGFWNPAEIPTAIIIRPVMVFRNGEEYTGTEYQYYLVYYDNWKADIGVDYPMWLPKYLKEE